MKNLQSIEEGKWVEIVSIKLTETELELLKSNNIVDVDAKKALTEKLQTEGKKSVSASIASKAKSKYNQIKPALKEEDVYQFIAAVFQYDESNIVKGILDCRINEEHVQIRF